MTLEDLTKEELISLIRRYWTIGPQEKDIWRVRLDTVAATGAAMRNEAVLQMNRGIGEIGVDGILQAHKLFDEGMAIYYKHQAMLREFEQKFYGQALAFLSEGERP